MTYFFTAQYTGKQLKTYWSKGWPTSCESSGLSCWSYLVFCHVHNWIYAYPCGV